MNVPGQIRCVVFSFRAVSSKTEVIVRQNQNRSFKFIQIFNNAQAVFYLF